jgi:hypothetical protein
MKELILIFVVIHLTNSQPAYNSLASIEVDLRNMNINLMTAQQQFEINEHDKQFILST